MSSFPDLGRMVLEITVTARLGDRAENYDIPGMVNTIADRLGFVDMDEIDHWVFEEIADLNRKCV